MKRRTKYNEKQRERQRRYRATAKGKATVKRYQASGKTITNSRNYRSRVTYLAQKFMYALRKAKWDIDAVNPQKVWTKKELQTMPRWGVATRIEQALSDYRFQHKEHLRRFYERWAQA